MQRSGLGSRRLLFLGLFYHHFLNDFFWIFFDSPRELCCIRQANDRIRVAN